MHVLFLGELFVLFLLLPVVFRTFVKKRNKVDTSVIFSLFALIVAVLLILADGLSLSVIVVAVPCLFVFIFNLRSLGRFFQQLKMDAYTPGAVIVSLVGILLVAGGAYVIIRFYPVSTFKHLNSSDCEAVEIVKKNYTGSFSEGFTQVSSIKEPVTSVFYKYVPFSVYSNQQSEDELPVVLFLPDVYTSISENRLTIESITRKGNIVICADFYAKDKPYLDSFWNSRICRSFVLQSQRFKAEAENQPVDAQQLEKWQQIKAEELATLVDYAKQENLFERVVLIVADGNASLAAKDFLEAEKIEIPLFKIDENIPGYISGMGNYAVNQPFAYNFVSSAPSDGWIQAQQIALRAEKTKIQQKKEEAEATAAQAENADAAASAAALSDSQTEAN